MNLHKPDDKTRRIVYITLICYWILLLIATSIPSQALPELLGSDKVKHFLAYAGLTVLLTATLLVQDKNIFFKKNAFISAVLVVIVYGFLDEMHQLFIPGRDAEFLDWVADFGGALTGSFIFLLYYKYEKNISSHT